MPRVDENGDQLEFSHTAGGSINWYNHLENCLVVCKAKHAFSMTPKFYLKVYTPEKEVFVNP